MSFSMELFNPNHTTFFLPKDIVYLNFYSFVSYVHAADHESVFKDSEDKRLTIENDGYNS